ncbi:MAG: hypothetical protein HGGPFJEG_02892 [Ignavibacteria bacterium]|nr:hypothetical protein [Ignavibacteria bacterium]
MKKSDDLFLLIKSLSKSEKRYFKLTSSRHTKGEKKNYLRLFEKIDKQERYDEAKLKKEFQNEKFTEHFFAIKSYLFDVILNSLIDFNREKQTDYKLYEDIIKINILISKGLNKSALKLAEKSAEKAKANSKYFMLEELLNIQSSKILLANIFLLKKKAGKIHYDKLKTLEELTSYIHYTILYEKFSIFFITTPLASSNEEIKKLDWLKNDPLFFDESNAKGYLAKENLYQIKRRYYWFIGDYEKSVYYRKKDLSLYDEYPLIKKSEPQKYFLAIHSYLMHAWFNISLSECEEYFTRLKTSAVSILQSAKNESVIRVVFAMFFIAEVLWLEKKGDQQKILSKLETLDEQLKKFNTTLETPKLLDIYSATGAALFRMGDYGNALPLTNNVLNHKESNKLGTLFHINLVRAIVIHFELGNYDIIEYLIKKLSRINIKDRRILSSEKNLIKTINGLIKTTSKKECLYLLEDFKIMLEKLSVSMLEKIFITRLGLMKWVERNIAKIKKEM